MRTATLSGRVRRGPGQAGGPDLGDGTSGRDSTRIGIGDGTVATASKSSPSLPPAHSGRFPQAMQRSITPDGRRVRGVGTYSSRVRGRAVSALPHACFDQAVEPAAQHVWRDSQALVEFVEGASARGRASRMISMLHPSPHAFRTARESGRASYRSSWRCIHPM